MRPLHLQIVGVYYKGYVSPMPNAIPRDKLLKSLVQLFSFNCRCTMQPTTNVTYLFWEYPNKFLEILHFTMYLLMRREPQAKFMNGRLDDKSSKAQTIKQSWCYVKSVKGWSKSHVRLSDGIEMSQKFGLSDEQCEWECNCDVACSISRNHFWADHSSD